MPYYPEYMMDAVPADITAIESDGSTYIGRFDRAHVVDGTPIEDQAIWQIRKVELLNVDGATIYRTLYPNGVRTYSEVWNNHTQLSYNFNKN